jgi:hypothetical protein
MKLFIMHFLQPPTLHISLVQIFSSAPCSQTPSVCVPPLMSGTKFHTHTEPQAKLQFSKFQLLRFRQQTGRQNFWSEALPEFNFLLISA